MYVALNILMNNLYERFLYNIKAILYTLTDFNIDFHCSPKDRLIIIFTGRSYLYWPYEYTNFRLKYDS